MLSRSFSIIFSSHKGRSNYGTLSTTSRNHWAPSYCDFAGIFTRITPSSTTQEMRDSMPLLPAHHNQYFGISQQPQYTGAPRRHLHIFLLLIILLFLFSHLCFKQTPPDFAIFQSASIPSNMSDNDTTHTSNRAMRMLSLNVFIRPLLIGLSDQKDRRLELLEPKLADYDLVCLQELFWTSGNRKKDFLKKLSQDGFKYAASAPGPSVSSIFRLPPKAIDAGLSIVSRKPILEIDYDVFKDATFFSVDLFVGKGVLYTRIQVSEQKPDEFCHVFTTHLQANNGLDEGLFVGVRRKQLKQMVEFVKEKTKDDPDGVIILAGDFNVNARKERDDDSSSAEYLEAVEILKEIRPQVKLRDLLFEANGNKHPVTSAGGIDGKSQKNERLDYIFLSSSDNGTEKRSNDNKSVFTSVIDGSVKVNEMEVDQDESLRTLSDHYALVADIKFN